MNLKGEEEIMERLRIKKPSDREEMRYALEAALLLGFQSETAVFPARSEEHTSELQSQR